MIRNPQRGAALLAAMLVVTLATALVSGLLWREHLRVRTLENQRLRDEAQWIGTGALDWARLVLREDLYQTRAVDHLGEVWAVPIAETPLSDFLNGPGESSAQADPENQTWLAGGIVDATSRFNLTSLVEESNPMGDRGWASATGINTEAVAIFARLLQGLGLDPAGAPQVARVMLQSRAPQTAEGDAPLPLAGAQDLLGLIPDATSESLAQLALYTVVLPRPTAVNANTASAVVLAAALGVDQGTAEQLIAERNQAFFMDYMNLISRVHARAPQGMTISARNLGVNSEYFWVVERLRHGRVSVTQQALVARRAHAGNATQVLWLKPGLPDGVSVGG